MGDRVFMYGRTAMRALPLAAVLLLSACAYGPTVRTDFDPAANFQTYRTYSWIETGVPQGMKVVSIYFPQALRFAILLSAGTERKENRGDFGLVRDALHSLFARIQPARHRESA